MRSNLVISLAHFLKKSEKIIILKYLFYFFKKSGRFKIKFGNIKKMLPLKSQLTKLFTQNFLYPLILRKRSESGFKLNIFGFQGLIPKKPKCGVCVNAPHPNYHQNQLPLADQPAN